MNDLIVAIGPVLLIPINGYYSKHLKYLKKTESSAPNFVAFAILKTSSSVLCQFRLNLLAPQAYSWIKQGFIKV